MKSFAMKMHFDLLFNNTNRKLTFLFLVLSLLFVVSALLVGIQDNIPAIAILMAGVAFFAASMVHIWQRTGTYLKLALIAVLAFPPAIVLHNIFSGIAGLIEETSWGLGVLNFLYGFFFVVALLVCPSVAFTGLLGALILFLKRRKKKSRNNVN